MRGYTYIASAALCVLLAAVASSAAARPRGVVFEYTIQNRVMEGASGSIAASGAARGWRERTLYLVGPTTAEYTRGLFPGPEGGVVPVRKVYIETPTWWASFDPDTGRGTRGTFGAGHRRQPDEMVASSDAAELLTRTGAVARLGGPIGSDTVAGLPCRVYRVAPDIAKVDLCVADIDGITVVLRSTWYERDTLWTEAAREVRVGSAIPPDVFFVPLTVRDVGARP